MRPSYFFKQLSDLINPMELLTRPSTFSYTRFKMIEVYSLVQCQYSRLYGMLMAPHMDRF